jgi:hypothetical protein
MKNLSIKNSTIQFLIFVSENKGENIDIFFHGGDLWITQKMLAKLFGVDRSVITKHI